MVRRQTLRESDFPMTAALDTTSVLAAVDTLRRELMATMNNALDSLIATLVPTPPQAGMVFKIPTLVDGHDPRNKNGLNLTPRGVEILYRLFDDGAGYNRAAKTLNITQAAAKNRKGIWTKLGGVNRQKQALDID